MKITVGDLDGILLTKFPADQISSVDFRIRSVLSLSSGTGSYVYSSATKTVDVTTYGPPTLALTVAGKLYRGSFLRSRQQNLYRLDLYGRNPFPAYPTTMMVKNMAAFSLPVPYPLI